jgi:hypothetical protein
MGDDVDADRIAATVADNGDATTYADGALASVDMGGATPAEIDADAESLDALFGYAPVDDADAAAADALSTAFAGAGAGGDAEASEATAAEPSAGRPTRPATTELSLDQIFRGAAGDTTPRRATPSTFSFDQFFADESGAEAEGGATEPAAPARPGEESASDLEQFNSWLESLKRK